MNEIEYNSVQDQPSMFMTDLDDSLYFNPRLNVVRVKGPLDNDARYDFKLAPTWFPPNPKAHRILLITSKQQMSTWGISPDRLALPPGLDDNQGTPAELPMGMAFIMDRNQRLYTADSQNGSAGFAIKDLDMTNNEDIKVALTPPLERDYTNTGQEDDANLLGMFMTNNTIMIKSKGGQVTLGDEGIHFGGKIHWESTTHSKEIMQDNFIHQLVPSTIPTAAISIPQLPNFGMIAQIAEVANKTINIVDTAGSVIDLIGG